MFERKRKTLLIAIVSWLVLTGILVLCFQGVINDGDLENKWNNGFCQCGGEWEFSNASHGNSCNFYYYLCPQCGDVVVTTKPQVKK